MGFDTFIFDFDLTLADSSEAILICFKHTFKEFGYQLPSDEEIYNTIGLTIEDAFTELVGVKDEDKKACMKQCYVKKADEVMAEKTYFYSGAVELLTYLRSHEYKTGIVSTKFRYRIVETFQKQGKPLEVDMIVGGEDVSVHKPDPAGLEMIIEKLGSDKSRTIYIGDSYIDAMTAENAGVKFGGVTTGPTNENMFSGYASLAVSDSLTGLFQKLSQIL